MTMIDKKRVLQEFLELVRIPCPTHGEREIGDLLTQRLIALGGTVHEDKAGEALGGNCGNLVADFPGTVPDAPVIMLTAHMDCVEPCRGIEPILETLRQLHEQSIPHGPLQVVFTIAEENGVHGSQHLASSLLHADYGYTLDTHGHPGTMSFKAPGKNQICIRLQGKAAHAGVEPENGINAIQAAGKLIATAPQGRIDDETTCNIGRIIGGSATNIVAETCEIFYESRSRDKEKLDRITSRITEHFQQGARALGCQAAIEVSPDYGTYSLSIDAPAIELARQAAEALGFPVELEESGGGSDANHFNTYGVPTVVLGVGMTNCHTREEYIEEKDLYNAARWTLQIVKDAGQRKE